MLDREILDAVDIVLPTDGWNLGEETPVGEGDVDFPAVIRKLKALGYDGSLTIEREIEGDRQIADIRAAKKMIENLIRNEEC